jgi:hypothetical protein
VLNYSGMVFTILFIAGLVALIASGAGNGILEKILPSLPKN